MTGPQPLSACAQPLAETYDVALLDLDGVVYRGAEPVGHAAASLAAAREAGMRLAFVTNNASRRPEAVADHLSALGVPASADDVVTSAQAAVRLLAEVAPGARRVLVLGGVGLRTAAQDAGLELVEDADAQPQAVLQGLSQEMTYADLAEACLALRRGVTWVAANRDATLPTTRGELPGCGALVAALEAATGRRPEVAGKPELTLHEESVRRSRARRPLVVGDRLDTDIAGAQAAGTPSLLVLTGVTDLAALERAGPGERPTYLAADLRGLLTAHPPDDELSAARSRLAAAWGAAESPA